LQSKIKGFTFILCLIKYALVFKNYFKMENKIKYVMEPGKRVPRETFEEKFGGKSNSKWQTGWNILELLLCFLP
jgi:hypothetical protein